MFDFGFGELLLLAVIALVVLGPERLPVAARLLGRWIRGARNQWNAVKAELENELADDELRRSLREASDALRHGGQQLRDVHDGLADATGQMTRMGTKATAAPAAVAPEPAAESATPADLPAAPDPAQLSLLDPPPAHPADEPRDG